MDYGELIAEVAERVKEPGFAMRAEQFVKQAEADLSQRFLPYKYPFIDSLVDSGSNWLMRENQEIYIAAVLKQFYLFKQDGESADSAEAYLGGLVERKKRADKLVVINREPYITPGPTP